MASSRELPHISASGRSHSQTAGRPELPNKAQRRSAVRWGQGRPAGFPPGRPGMEEDIDSMMQQAPQPGRQESPPPENGSAALMRLPPSGTFSAEQAPGLEGQVDLAADPGIGGGVAQLLLREPGALPVGGLGGLGDAQV